MPEDNDQLQEQLEAVDIKILAGKKTLEEQGVPTPMLQLYEEVYRPFLHRLVRWVWDEQPDVDNVRTAIAQTMANMVGEFLYATCQADDIDSVVNAANVVTQQYGIVLQAYMRENFKGKAPEPEPDSKPN